MKRSVLIITPFFAPQSHAAVFRAYKLAKYLPRYGWKPYVLTVDKNYLYNEDRSLLDDLPAEVEIATARYVEPTARGLRMALGGRDRTFAAIKRDQVRRPSIDDHIRTSRNKGLVNNMYDYIIDRWVHVPDAHWTWRGPALRTARALIRKRDVGLVFTSANPFTSHGIGLALQRDGLRWVADLRDPHTYCRQMFSRYPNVFTKQRRIEGEAVRKADAVTVASSAIAMILTDSYGAEATRRTRFIPTGLDDALIPSLDDDRPRPYPYLLFTGEYLNDYGSEFFEIFAAALARPEVRSLGVKLLIVGRLDINERRVGPIVRRLGIDEYVELIDHVPQRELYRLLRGAEAGVLLTNRLFRWWCLYAKMVDYLALRKPVVAVLPDPSEARTRLTNAGLGIFLDGPHDKCATKLADFLTGSSVRPRPEVAECDRFLASSQVQSFVELFEEVSR